MGATVGLVVRIVVTVALGLVLGFFVAISAFADGPWEERRLLIGGLLLGYGLAGAALGLRASAWYGLGLAAPGVVVLFFLAFSGEGTWGHLLYAATIAVLSVGGAYASATRWPGARARDGMIA